MPNKKTHKRKFRIGGNGDVCIKVNPNVNLGSLVNVDDIINNKEKKGGGLWNKPTYTVEQLNKSFSEAQYEIEFEVRKGKGVICQGNQAPTGSGVVGIVKDIMKAKVGEQDGGKKVTLLYLVNEIFTDEIIKDIFKNKNPTAARDLIKTILNRESTANMLTEYNVSYDNVNDNLLYGDSDQRLKISSISIVILIEFVNRADKDNKNGPGITTLILGALALGGTAIAAASGSMTTNSNAVSVLSAKDYSNALHNRGITHDPMAPRSELAQLAMAHGGPPALSEYSPIIYGKYPRALAEPDEDARRARVNLPPAAEAERAAWKSPMVKAREKKEAEEKAKEQARKRNADEAWLQLQRQGLTPRERALRTPASLAARQWRPSGVIIPWDKSDGLSVDWKKHAKEGQTWSEWAGAEMEPDKVHAWRAKDVMILEEAATLKAEAEAGQGTAAAHAVQDSATKKALAHGRIHDFNTNPEVKDQYLFEAAKEMVRPIVNERLDGLKDATWQEVEAEARAADEREELRGLGRPVPRNALDATRAGVVLESAMTKAIKAPPFDAAAETALKLAIQDAELKGVDEPQLNEAKELLYELEEGPERDELGGGGDFYYKTRKHKTKKHKSKKHKTRKHKSKKHKTRKHKSKKHKTRKH